MDRKHDHPDPAGVPLVENPSTRVRQGAIGLAIAATCTVWFLVTDTTAWSIASLVGIAFGAGWIARSIVRGRTVRWIPGGIVGFKSNYRPLYIKLSEVDRWEVSRRGPNSVRFHAAGHSSWWRANTVELTDESAEFLLSELQRLNHTVNDSR